MAVSRRFTEALVLLAWLAVAAAPARAALPENLALRATATATSEYDEHHLARFAIDGKIPKAQSTFADLDAAWCVRKARSGDKASFTLTWKEPVEAAEIVYWGRTSYFLDECWKDYDVFLDKSDKPAARGTLRMVDGPQRIRFAKTKVRQITLKFHDSYGGANPGAAEIQVFGSSPAAADLAALRRLGGPDPQYAPAVTKIKPAAAASLSRLITQLEQIHGGEYGQAAEHRARLARWEQDRRTAPAGTRPEKLQSQLDALQRDVLLFDVDKVLLIKRHEILASHVYTYHYEGFRAGGGLYVVSLRTPQAPPRELAAAPTGQILDCDLSYDGRAALFSWRRRKEEGYHLWTVGVDGRGLKQLTRGAWHDYNACWLPDGGIAFLSTRWPQFAYCWHAPVGVLCRMNADGSGFRRLSANYLNDFTPNVLDNGRILYTRWEYVDRPAIPIQSLWTINPDGTGLAGYFGNRKISPATFMEARSIPGTTKILCTMTGHNGPTRGAIGVIDRRRGDNAQASIENITPDVPVPGVAEGNGNTSGSKPYSSPFPLDAARLLLSARGPVLVRTLDGQCQSLALQAPSDGMQYFAAQPVRCRVRPPVLPSLLPKTEEATAVVYLQDVYNGLEPYVRRGEVERIRIVREMFKSVRIDPQLRAFGFQFPVISCGATYAAKQVIGEVPVEPDGSACFRVPAQQPLYFMALDRQGRAVQRMRSFTHLMPGEVQGCIGCHESRQHAPKGRSAVTYDRPPLDPQPPEWGRGGFDYSRIVQPVLDRYCVECHNPREPGGRIDLSGGKTDFFNVSYDVLARENSGRTGSPWVKWIPTLNGQEWNILQITPKFWGSPSSRLAELIASGHPGSDGKPRLTMDEKSRRRVFAWIDLNVPYYGSSETAYPDKPGCRQIVPADLDRVLSDVGQRRCAECHAGGKFPRRVWTRITEPELNPFLLAPLARSAGGTEKCGRAVFRDRSDPDYQAVLKLFEPITAMLRDRPRMDMPGGRSHPDVCRTCQ